MRKIIMMCGGVVAMLMAAAIVSPAAQALTLAAPAGLSKAIHETALTQDVAYVCRRGWRRGRCWWTPGYAYYRPYYAYSAYAYYRPYPRYYRSYAYYRPYYRSYRPYAYYRPAFAAYAFFPTGYYRPYRPYWGWRYRRWGW